MLDRIRSVFVVAAAAAGLCLVAAPALAQPAGLTKDEAKCETSTGKALTKQVGALAKCGAKCISTARKATPGPGQYDECFNAPPASPTGLCQSDPVTGKGAKEKAAAAIIKACTDAPPKDKCPECYGTATCTSGDPFVSTTQTLTMLQGPSVYCTENGGTTPSKEVGKCEDGLGKTLTKWVGSLSKCYDKCNQQIVKGTLMVGDCDPPNPQTIPPSTTVPPDQATRDCLTKARDKTNAALDKACFVAPAQAPTCYDGTPTRPNNAANWTNLVETIVGGQTPAIACGSPSGAFLE